MNNTNKPTINIELTVEQIHALTLATDLYKRIGLGQAEELAKLVREGVMPVKRNKSLCDVADEVEKSTATIKEAIGFSTSECYGFQNRNVNKYARLTYDLNEVFRKILAENPLPPQPKEEFVSSELHTQLMTFAKEFIKIEGALELELKNTNVQTSCMTDAFARYIFKTDPRSERFNNVSFAQLSDVLRRTVDLYA